MMESIEKHSPWTCQLQICALGKLYDCSITSFNIDLPKRKRSQIKRSRHSNQMDKHFSEKNNADLLCFCKCFGLRRRELAAINGDALEINSKGEYILNVTKGTKGGRVRKVPIANVNQEELETVIRLCKDAGNYNVFKKISPPQISIIIDTFLLCGLMKSTRDHSKNIKTSDLLSIETEL